MTELGVQPAGHISRHVTVFEQMRAHCLAAELGNISPLLSITVHRGCGLYSVSAKSGGPEQVSLSVLMGMENFSHRQNFVPTQKMKVDDVKVRISLAETSPAFGAPAISQSVPDSRCRRCGSTSVETDTRSEIYPRDYQDEIEGSWCTFRTAAAFLPQQPFMKEAENCQTIKSVSAGADRQEKQSGPGRTL